MTCDIDADHGVELREKSLLKAIADVRSTVASRTPAFGHVPCPTFLEENTDPVLLKQSTTIDILSCHSLPPFRKHARASMSTDYHYSRRVHGQRLSIVK